MLGPVVGGSFVVSSATWRWAFYINLIIGAAFAPVYVFGLPAVHPVTGVSIMDRLKRIDWLGMFLMAGVWVSFGMAFTMAGGQWPWNDGRTIGTIVAFAVTLLLFVLQQGLCILTSTENRAFPVHLPGLDLRCFSSSARPPTSPPSSFSSTSFRFISNSSTTIPPCKPPFRLMPYVVVTVCFNLGAGHLLSKVRYYMPIFVLSGVFMTVGGALLTAYLNPSTPQRASSTAFPCSRLWARVSPYRLATPWPH